jgi:aarF domain-containing kinase
LEEFNKLPNDIFSEFDYKALAAASLAHVHEAKTKSGEKIAVKLQYIDLRDRFSGDIFTMKALLTMIGWLFPSFSFSWVLDVIDNCFELLLFFEK